MPFRFIRPWLNSEVKGMKDGTLNRAIKGLATIGTKHKLPYYFDKDKLIFDEDWFNYFQAHLKIMEDFCLWNLLNYLQKRNSNVPNISSKLFPPHASERRLAQERKYWSLLATHTTTPFRCIFSNELINFEKYALDHFIPWSFVTHNQLWNLTPIIPNVNSQKSNHLPHLNTYFKKFGQVQYKAFHLGTHLNQKKVLENYLSIVGHSIQEIRQLSENEFITRLENQIQPLYQIAQNMGF